MPKVTGKTAVKRYFSAVPTALIEKVLPGAARAGGKVIADEAELRCESDIVRKAIVTRVKREGTLITVKVGVKGRWANAVGNWLEYGTDGHFISVDDSQRQGRSVNRINRLAKAGSLVISGQFVGNTVWHPGARPYPFLRPALDLRQDEAIAAAQGYINARLSRLGLSGSGDPGGE